RTPQPGTKYASIVCLFKDRKVSGVPCLDDDVVLAPDPSKHGIVVVLEISETKVLLGHDRRDELVIFEDVDRRAFLGIRAIQTPYDRILIQIVDIARQRPGGRFQRGEITPVACEAFDAGVWPVGDVDALGSRRYSNTVRGLKLTVRFAL